MCVTLMRTPDTGGDRVCVWMWMCVEPGRDGADVNADSDPKDVREVGLILVHAR